jgi:hypothetical protein
MDGSHIAAASPEAGGASSSASSASSYGGSASGRSWLRKGVHLRRRRRRVAVRGGERAGGDDVQDLALPLGMSFAAVLAQVSGMYLGSLSLFLSTRRRPKDSIFTRFVRSSLSCHVWMVGILCARICSWLLLIR